MNDKINIDEIKLKNEIIDNAIVTLKKEFIGIDKQIDDIMYNLRTWYLYPNLQSRPLVISLWGMSGIGKTSLVKRISELLDVEKDYVYFNFASITESTSWEIEQQIEDEISNENPRRMFIYDEFQYAATKNPNNGEERENKSGLKTFWELLDSGILRKRTSFSDVQELTKIITYMQLINSRCTMEIKECVWVNAKECLEHFSPYEQSKFKNIFNTGKYDDNDDESNDYDLVDGYYQKGMFFLVHYQITRIARFISRLQNDCSFDELKLFNLMRNMDAMEIIDYFYSITKGISKGYSLSFNESVVFVIGNLDEAYEMSFNVNPDMSPDQFRKITEDISVVDIKDALRRRFRNEQIARLGNIHVIYPSFSIQNYKDLIDFNLDKYKVEAKEICGYDLEFDETIKKIIYDEGVFPTQGTRPILSTIHEIVKSRLPEIVRSICDSEQVHEVSTIRYAFNYETNEIVVYCLNSDGEIINDVSFNANLRLKKLRDNGDDKDEQALCALHESGHFVMYAKLFGKLPEKLVSRTADSDSGGFLMEDIDNAKKKVSKRDKLKELQVLLGGFVAEKMFFGEEMTTGAVSDLRETTMLASKYIRYYCFGNNSYITTYVKGSHEDIKGLVINEDNQNYINNEIKELIRQAENDVRDTLNDPVWRKMLKESALYLCENSSMPKEKMQEMFDLVPEEYRMATRDNNYYRNSIENI